MTTADVELLGPSDAGRQLGVTGQWVRQLVERGELKGIKTSLGTLVDRRDVERLAAERQAKGRGR
jgi:hypothetical protein